MTRKEIINGLKMSMDLTLFDPSTGEVMEPWQLNEVNRTAYEAYKGAIELLEEMPSAQPEHKTGRWIPTYEDCCADVWVKWKCSECGYVRKKGWKQTYDGAKPDALFCEMCNADMRGEQDG